MGLDMYLQRMPRYGNTTPEQICALESYLDWKKKKENPESNARKYTLKEWCGVEYKDVPKGKAMGFYQAFLTIKYYFWDTEKRYPHEYIMEEIGYWRKANQIHKWFVDNVQDGVDDCDYHHEVTKEKLEKLLDTCKTVLKSCELVTGKIQNGWCYENGKEHPIIEDGKYVKDSSVAEKLLPTSAGCFFGGYNYDQYYVDDIKETINIITAALETTDFEKQMIYYRSSW